MVTYQTGFFLGNKYHKHCVCSHLNTQILGDWKILRLTDLKSQIYLIQHLPSCLSSFLGTTTGQKDKGNVVLYVLSTGTATFGPPDLQLSGSYFLCSIRTAIHFLSLSVLNHILVDMIAFTLSLWRCCPFIIKCDTMVFIGCLSDRQTTRLLDHASQFT